MCVYVSVLHDFEQGKCEVTRAFRSEVRIKRIPSRLVSNIIPLAYGESSTTIELAEERRKKPSSQHLRR